MIKQLLKRELKQAEKDSWDKHKSVRYEVLIYRNGSYFRKVFIDKEHGLLENPTVEQIKAFAKSGTDKVFKITTIQERIK